MSPEGVKAMHDQIQALQSKLQEARDELELLRNQKFDGKYHDTLRSDYDTLKAELARAEWGSALQVELAEARAIVKRQYNTIIRLNDKWEASEAEVARLQGENETGRKEIDICRRRKHELRGIISLRERQLEIAKEFIGEAEYGSGGLKEAFNILVTLANLEVEANKSGVKS